MIDKVFASPEEAVAGIPDGATVLIGGFVGAGIPQNLTSALVKQGAKDLTVICNSSVEPAELAEAHRIKNLVCGLLALHTEVTAAERQYHDKEIEVELVPQGTLLERLRAGGAGLAAVYTPTGVGTPMAKGKERRTFGGKEYVLETALRADFALIKAYRGDRLGNLTYRLLARNINPTMATAADVTIAEVEEIVDPGQLDPEDVVTPGIYVDRLVKAEKGTRWLKRSWYRTHPSN